MSDLSAAIQSQLRVVQLFDSTTQGAALDALASNPASIGETDRRALATLAITGSPEVQATARELLGNVV
jgi:hypothetical protein